MRVAALALLLAGSASAVDLSGVGKGTIDKEGEAEVEAEAPSTADAADKGGSSIGVGAGQTEGGAGGLREGAKDKSTASTRTGASSNDGPRSYPARPSFETSAKVGPSGDPACDALAPRRGYAVPPPPSAFNGGADAIDLRKVTVVKGVHIANWKITSTVKKVTVGGGSICVDHTKLENWPTSDFFGEKETQVEGNQWIFAYINGRWYGGAGEWIRPGQLCKAVDAGNVGCGVFYDSEPLKSWRPAHGEIVGIAVSQPARAGQWGLAERTNVTLVKWP